MKINFDFNPKSLKESEIEKQESEIIFNNREVVILNRKYKCKTFSSQEDADIYLSKHPNMELLSVDIEGFNIIPLDYYGTEVNFTPYEFKRYEISTINKVEVIKKPSRITWISEETTLKKDLKRKRWDS